MAKAATAMKPGTNLVVMSNENNRQFWDALRTPDPAATKKFDRGGFKGTMTSPIYIAQRMTEVFGPVGLGWGWEIQHLYFIPAERPEVCHGQVLVWWKFPELVGDGPGGRCEIVHVGGGQLLKYRKVGGETKPVGYDDEAVKGIITDAIGKALSYLGMSADIHMGLFDDVKYLKEAGGIFDQTDPTAPSVIGASTANAIADAANDRGQEERPPPKPIDPVYAEAAKWIAAIEDLPTKAENVDAIYQIRDEAAKWMETVGKDNENVQAVRKAWSTKRRAIEDLLEG